MKLGTMLLVEWTDSHQKGGWTNDPIEAAIPLVCRSVGWLISKTRDAITLAANTVPSLPQQRSGEMTIPVRNIVRARALPAGTGRATQGK